MEMDAMDPRKVSAQFAAFVWFTNRAGQAANTSRKAWAYARQNWQQFLPNAHDGLGRLLLQIADSPCRQRVKRPARSLAAAC
jgi:hypothetical protein